MIAFLPKSLAHFGLPRQQETAMAMICDVLLPLDLLGFGCLLRRKGRFEIEVEIENEKGARYDA